MAGAPSRPGLTFRRFRGELDYPFMVAVIEGSKEVDGLERTDTVQDVARFYDNLFNWDPYQDMLFVEVEELFAEVLALDSECGCNAYSLGNFGSCVKPPYESLSVGGLHCIAADPCKLVQIEDERCLLMPIPM